MANHVFLPLQKYSHTNQLAHSHNAANVVQSPSLNAEGHMNVKWLEMSTCFFHYQETIVQHPFDKNTETKALQGAER